MQRKLQLRALVHLRIMNRSAAVRALREKLRSGGISVGSWMQLPEASIAEILASGQFDWVTLDLEHGQIGYEKLPDLFRAIESKEKLGFARLIAGNEIECKRALDAGAAGLIIPMVESADQMSAIMSFSKWPPAGRRGVAFSRANLFGREFTTYIEEAQSPFIVPMIESIKAVKDLESICSVPGIDALLVGPYDLSASMGAVGEFESAAFLGAMDRILQIAEQHGIPCGIHVVQPNKLEVQTRIRGGFRFIAYSLDVVVLSAFSSSLVIEELGK